jgi:YVTN family beta-propeller protein
VKGEVAGTIATGQVGSHMVAVTADGKRAYTANIGSGSITELDLVKRAPGRTLAVAPRTEGIGVTPDGREVWVGSNDAHTVTVIDTRTWAPVATISTPGLPYRINMTPDGKTAIVTCPMADAVRLIDVATRKERAVVQLGGAQPVGATVSADGRHAFIALQGTGEAVMVELAGGKEVRRFRTGAGPDGIAVARVK